MQNKLPKFLDNHKICIICEGNEEYEYLNRIKNLKVWNEQEEKKKSHKDCKTSQKDWKRRHRVYDTSWRRDLTGIR